MSFQVIAAEGEQNASRALKEAADIMSQSPAALQLRYLQTLNTISAEKNSTIIFPLPIDLLGGLIHGFQGNNNRQQESVQPAPELILAPPPSPALLSDNDEDGEREGGGKRGSKRGSKRDKKDEERKQKEKEKKDGRLKGIFSTGHKEQSDRNSDVPHVSWS